jgi:hypothetical protein
MSSVRISAANLYTYGVSASGATEREPLSQLGDRENAGHIHGRLVIDVNGRPIPHLGFFGPDDVCLDTWVVELCKVVNALGEGRGEYTFDEGEQGQPAFRFARFEHEIVISIIESTLSDGGADPEWQSVRCSYQDFRAAVVRFLDELRDELRKQAPENGARWWPNEAVVNIPR